MSKPALVRNAGDPKQVRKAAKTERQRKIEADTDLDAMLQTYEGRATLWRVLERCNVFATSIARDVSDAIDVNATLMNEGRRNVGISLLADITRVNLDAYQLAQKEAADRLTVVQEPAPRTDEPFTEPEDDDGNDSSA